MANDAQMLPCPWCQTKTSLAASQVCTGGGWGIMCKSCHVFLDVREENPAAAIAAWNRRSDLCASGQQVRALELRLRDWQGRAEMAGRALEAVLSGKPVRNADEIVSFCKTAALTPAPQPSETVAELVAACDPLLSGMALWTESAEDTESVILTVGTVRRIRAALRALKGGDV